jgi:putative ABC transport system ATP-binding protein
LDTATHLMNATALTTTATPAIQIRDLMHSYEVDRGSLVVLRDANFMIASGESVAIMGPSGAGKTTLLSLIGGLDRVQSGSLQVHGHELARMSSDDLAKYRRETIGFVFQDYGLLPTLNAFENVELALTLSGMRRSERRRRAKDLLATVGLDDRGNHRPNALSGGESQRVSIARSLANEPRVVLADEPTGNLDGVASANVLALLLSLPRDRGCTVVIVTHNLAVAQQCDRIIELEAKTELVVPV